jgi:hypothetical protein
VTINESCEISFAASVACGSYVASHRSVPLSASSSLIFDELDSFSNGPLAYFFFQSNGLPHPRRYAIPHMLGYVA